MSRPDVLVIGGGVIGAAAARALARQGWEVRVLEGAVAGAAASSAAAGMLSPHPEADEATGPGDPFLALCRRSLGLHRDLARCLLEETGIDVEYRAEGTLEVALAPASAEALRGKACRQSAMGFPAELVSAEEARRMEPALSPRVQAALWYPQDHQVENRRLVAALVQAACRAGARFEQGRLVTGFLVEGGRLRGARCGPEPIEAGRVVLAAGCGSAGLALPGRPPLPVEPIRGQMAALGTDGTLLSRVVRDERGYLVPRRDGRVLVGTTTERAGYDCRPTAEGLTGILSAGLALVPALAARPVVSVWAGLRPCTPDGWPVLGPDEEHPELVYATGHCRNGILLAPATAEYLVRVLAGEPVSWDPAPFRASRFGQGLRSAHHETGGVARTDRIGS